MVVVVVVVVTICQVVSEIAKVSARKAFRAAVLVNPAERKMTSTSGWDSQFKVES